MSHEERMNADFSGTGLTIGRHPMAYRRDALTARGVTPACHLPHMRNGAVVRVAGCVIVRQRPGTAKGFVFLSMEDETGVINAIVTPALFDRYRFELVQEPVLFIEGTLQNLDNVISVKAGRIEALPARMEMAPSHDFH
jgi:error-prone DNA polymerase